MPKKFGPLQGFDFFSEEKTFSTKKVGKLQQKLLKTKLSNMNMP